jgi:MFS transporter, NRE family, putaive nickel resistance protein
VIAGGVISFLGLWQVFCLDALSFWVAALLILTLPDPIRASPVPDPDKTLATPWRDVQLGTTLLFHQPQLRYALGMQLVGAIAGAQILVNTVGYVEGELGLSSGQYGWVMAAFGAGAFLFTALVGIFNNPSLRLTFIGLGAVLMALPLLLAQSVGWIPLMGLWLLAGGGEGWINLPTQTLIADLIPVGLQGRVYGAHFAWSHLWWVLAYPLAAWLETHPWQLPLLPISNHHGFLAGGLISLGVMLWVQLTLFSKQPATGLDPLPPQTAGK